MIVTRVFKDFIALVLVFVGDQKHLQFEEFFDFFLFFDTFEVQILFLSVLSPD